MRYLLPIILVLVGMSEQSCIECGPQAELSARVYFTSDSLELDSAYALKALDPKIVAEQARTYSGPYTEFHLPISMVSDTTTYVFVFKDRTDTLSIHYERIFRYKGGCGFITDAREPSHGNRYETTFKQVDIDYDTYARSGKSSFPAPERSGGISIRIRP